MRTKIFIYAASMLAFIWGFHIFMMFEKGDFENIWRFSIMGNQLVICILFYLWQTKGLKDGKID